MKKRWFTLIEMLIVIVIIGILAAALIPRIWGARDKANDVARQANVKSYATALSQYSSDKWWYPIGALSTANVFTGKYWLTTWLNGKPAATDIYTYTWLNAANGWASHFVVCIKLSDWSEAWNFTADMASGAHVQTTFTWVGAHETSTWQYYCNYM